MFFFKIIVGRGEQQRPLLQHNGGKKETCAKSQGKLAIKIQHCMVMNTNPTVKGSH